MAVVGEIERVVAFCGVLRGWMHMFYAIDEGRHLRSGDTPYKNITLLVTAMRRIQYYNYSYMAIRPWRKSSIFSYGDSLYKYI